MNSYKNLFNNNGVTINYTAATPLDTCNNYVRRVTCWGREILTKASLYNFNCNIYKEEKN